MTEPATRSTVDIGTILDDGPWRASQMLILLLLTLAFVADGLANQVMAVSVPSLMKDLHVRRDAFSAVTALGLVGVTLGTVFGGMLGDRIGRKLMLTLSVLLFGLATSFIAGVHDIHTLGWIRLVDGLGIGGAIPNATALIAEFTPARRRSRAVNTGLIGIPIGILLCGVIGAAVLPNHGWRTLFLSIGGISVALALLLAFAILESPRFLARSPKNWVALQRGLKRLGVVLSPNTVVEDASRHKERGPISEIFGRDMGPTTFGLWGAFFFCFMAVYTSLNWIPTLLSSHGYPIWATSLTLTAWSIGGIGGALVGSLLIERFGSRVTLVVLAIGGIAGYVGISTMPLRPEDGVGPVLTALGFQGICMSGLTGCLYALSAYIYPAHVKATGVGAAGAVGRSGAIVSSFAAVAVMNMGGSEAFFRFAGVMTLLSLVFILLIRRHIPREGEIIRGAAYR